MSKEELKMKFPETYNAIVQEGVMQERQRKATNEAFNFKLN